MAKSLNRRSNRSRKPKIHFDDIIQTSRPLQPSSEPSAAIKKPFKTSRASTKPPPNTKSSKKPLETPLDPLDLSILDPIEELCSRTAGLDINAKKGQKQRKYYVIKALEFKAF
jgi:hypothetical protein